jgi:hypothetical protein
VNGETKIALLNYDWLVRNRGLDRVELASDVDAVVIGDGGVLGNQAHDRLIDMIIDHVYAYDLWMGWDQDRVVATDCSRCDRGDHGA